MNTYRHSFLYTYLSLSLSLPPARGFMHVYAELYAWGFDLYVGFRGYRVSWGCLGKYVSVCHCPEPPRTGYC